jgi:hypothetical protein
MSDASDDFVAPSGDAPSAAAASRSREVVHALCWEDICEARSEADPSTEVTGWEAPTAFNTYYTIEQYFGSGRFGWEVKHDHENVGVFDDPDAAKFAAQADHARRVLSAIVGLPAAAVEAPGAEDVTKSFNTQNSRARRRLRRFNKTVEVLQSQIAALQRANPSPSILEGQEPVAWLCRLEDGEFVTLEEPDYGSFPVTPLYASPVLLPDGYVMGWQDISTAPIGTYALLFSERDRDISIRDFGQFAKYNSPKFTHWMPLPQLPIGTGEGR